MASKLIRKAFLYRSWQVVTAEGWFTVTYDGRGMGFESIFVDDNEVVRATSSLWFVPTFEFRVGTLPAQIEVRIWPWLGFRKIRFYLNDGLIYAEGDR